MKKLTIPKYTLGEEVTNSITHGLGVFFGIVILVLTIVMSAHNHNTVGVVASCIYGTSMIIMFLISCLYHAMSPRIGAKKVFRVLDHCDIYVFIAGSYTPFCISLIGGKVGWTLFGIIWACALFGVLLNSINLEKYKIIVGSSSNPRYLIDIFEKDKSKLTILVDAESISLAGNSVTFTSFEYPKVCMEIIISSIKEALK